MAEAKAVPQNGVVSAADVISKLLPIFTGSGTTTENTSGGSSSVGTISADAMSTLKSLLGSIMPGISDTSASDTVVNNIITRAQQAFAPVLASQKAAGLYNSSTVNLLGQEAIARATGEASSAVLQKQTADTKNAIDVANTMAQATRGTNTTTNNGGSKTTGPAIGATGSKVASGLAVAASLKSLLAGAGSNKIVNAGVDKLKSMLGFGEDASSAGTDFANTGGFPAVATSVGGLGGATSGNDLGMSDFMSNFNANMPATPELNALYQSFADTSPTVAAMGQTGWLQSVIDGSSPASAMPASASQLFSGYTPPIMGLVPGSPAADVFTQNAATASAQLDQTLGSDLMPQTDNVDLSNTDVLNSDQLTSKLLDNLSGGPAISFGDTAISAGLQAGSDLFASSAPDLMSSVMDVGSSLATPFADAAVGTVADIGTSAASDFATSAATDAVTGISFPYLTAAKAVGDIFGINEITGPINSLTSTVGDVASGAVDAASGLVQGVGDVASGIGDAVSSVAKSVICTELLRRGLLDEVMYRQAGRTFSSLPRNVIVGYHFWAKPYVQLMKMSDFATYFILPWAVGRAAYLTGKRSSLGWITVHIGEPICGLLGSIITYMQGKGVTNGAS